MTPRVTSIPVGRGSARRAAWIALVALFDGVCACGPLPVEQSDGSRAGMTDAPQGEGSPDDPRQDAGADAAVIDGAVIDGATADEALVTGARVVEFTPGEGAGFGQSRMPDIVLGPPEGAGDMRGGTHVVSLGRGGRICLAMRAPIVDGPGPDFIVFENPFIIAGTPTNYVELGEVSVSEDGQRFVRFPCERGAPHRGCAGVTPVYAHTGSGLSPRDPRYAGGDAFDLRDVGLARASVVCVTDLETQPPGPPSTGFDLDAIVAIHW